MDHTDHCHHCCDITDWDDPDDEELRDKGCCGPIPVKRDCRAPVLPVPECDEEDPIVTANADGTGFTVLTTLYDSNCSPITDSTGSPFLTLIA